MDFTKINTFYFNGCSHTAGGGLYEDLIKDGYKIKFGVEWDNERDITYPRYITDYFNVNKIDDSQCGSGAERLIRTTYEYIEKVGLEESKKTLFILQINGSINRVEYFCKEINDYLIVNVVYNDDWTFKYFDVVDKWSPDRKNPYGYYIPKIKNDIEFILNNYHEPIEYEKKIVREMLGLFNFFYVNDIQFLYYPDDKYYLGKYDSMFYYKNYIKIGSIHQYTLDNKMTIKDDLIGITNDTHPGYYGHKKYANELINYLEKYEMEKI